MGIRLRSSDRFVFFWGTELDEYLPPHLDRFFSLRGGSASRPTRQQKGAARRRGRAPHLGQQTSGGHVGPGRGLVAARPKPEPLTGRRLCGRCRSASLHGVTLALPTVQERLLMPSSGVALGSTCSDRESFSSLGSVNSCCESFMIHREIRQV